MKYYDKKIRFNVRGPWMKGRASFEIAKDVISANAPREHTKINDERIIALNRDYDAGKIDVHYGKKILLEIRTWKLESDLTSANRLFPLITRR